MSRRKEFFSTNLPPELVSWLRAESKATHVPQAALVEQALRDFQKKPRRALAPLDAAGFRLGVAIAGQMERGPKR